MADESTKENNTTDTTESNELLKKISDNPAETLKELEAKRTKAQKNETEIKDLKAIISEREEADKTAAQKKLEDAGELEKLIETLKMTNSELTVNNELLSTENTEFKTAAEKRAAKETAKKEVLIEEIKTKQPDCKLTPELPLSVIEDYKALINGKQENNTGVNAPNNGKGQEVNRDYSHLSPALRRIEEIRDLSR